MKKILILTSAGGGGHLSVSNALSHYFSQEYKIQITFIFTDILGPIDPAQILTFGKLTGEKFYNYFIQKKWYRLINYIYLVGRWYYKVTQNRTKQLLRNYLLHQSPDLVISVVPLINQEVLTVTQELGIPFILIPTDLDATTFISRMKKSLNASFACISPFKHKLVQHVFKNTEISNDQIHITGFPLRPDFFEEKNVNQLKSTYAIAQDKPVLLLLMGARGSTETLIYIKKLLALQNPAHIVIALGKSIELQKSIEALYVPPHISISVIGYTDRISDLMAVSDLLISKSGTVSVCESIYMNLPLLLDSTSTLISWEKLNHTFIKSLGFGDSITSHKDITKKVETYLNNPHLLKQHKNNLLNYKKANPYIELHNIIKKFI